MYYFSVSLGGIVMVLSHRCFHVSKRFLLLPTKQSPKSSILYFFQTFTSSSPVLQLKIFNFTQGHCEKYGMKLKLNRLKIRSQNNHSITCTYFRVIDTHTYRHSHRHVYAHIQPHANLQMDKRFTKEINEKIINFYLKKQRYIEICHFTECMSLLNKTVWQVKCIGIIDKAIVCWMMTTKEQRHNQYDTHSCCFI